MRLPLTGHIPIASYLFPKFCFGRAHILLSKFEGWALGYDVSFEFRHFWVKFVGGRVVDMVMVDRNRNRIF